MNTNKFRRYKYDVILPKNLQRYEEVESVDSINEKRVQDEDGIISVLKKEIDLLDNEILNSYKDKIVEYFEENKIDYDVISNMKLSDFRDSIADYCNDKKLRGQLVKLYKKLKEIASKNLNSIENDEDEFEANYL